MKYRIFKFFLLLILVVNLQGISPSLAQSEPAKKEIFVSENELEKTRKKKEFDYYDNYKQVEEKKPKHIDPPNLSWLAGLSQILPYIFIGLFAIVVLFILYNILVENKSYKRSPKEKKIEQQAIIEELDEETIADNDFDALIKKALAIEDFRLVMRLQFLKALQILDKKKIVVYKKNKTNFEYSFEIKESNLRNSFLQSSDVFAWIWYGRDSVDEESYKKLVPVFDHLLEILAKKKA